mgnify:CR=1 FL=1
MSTISFLSTRGRAMNIDLKIVQNYLASALPDTTFDYYMKNTATKIPAANQQLEKARLSFCKNARKLLCMDASIPIKLSPASSEERRILMLSPYDYLFNEYLKYVENPELAPKKTFIRCTHVMPGSPFFSKLLKNFYEFEDTTFIDDVCLPAAWDILQESRQTEIRNNFEYLYPQAKGKKILCILTANQNLNEESTALFSDLDFKTLLDKLGDEWFLITNNMNLLDKSIRLSYEYTNCFGYMKGRFNLNDLIYFSDMLVTNSSKHACTFAAASKPVYYLNYGKKHFGRYMKQFHPDLYLETAGELVELDYTQEDLSETEAKFCQEFSYSTKKNPLEELVHCLA